ncbi:MAG: Thioredoxin reductase [Ktedonobacterales bacterium]|jgi:thioredoxin reductase (NADPH)|nr:MAG: Thioredoxin reductase [Ktedonobacterales bacterium]
MRKPVLLAVDDDQEVLKAIERDLRREYGPRYRVVVASSGPRALAALRTLQLRNDPVALLLVDQRMPEMTGIEFLAEALKLYPDAKRALLTAYADTDVAINAINQLKLDYYLVKPWDPPESQLYPVLNDLLEQWRAFFRPPFEGVRVVGHRWSPLSYQVKDFLARNQIPYQWMDVEDDDEARKLVELAGAPSPSLPLLLFGDGTQLSAPTSVQVAEKIGLRTKATLPFYDLIIIGGGPAALASAVYGASEGLKTLMLERQAPGGQAGSSSRIENYLGFPVGLSGADLTRRSVAQAKRFGVEILTPQEATGLHLVEPYRVITLIDGAEISCHALIVATGVAYRQLDAPGVNELIGAGVYYGAAASEAPDYRGQDVFVVGGANSAGQAAMYFSKYCRSVTVLVRARSLAETMSQYLQDQIAATDNIHVRTQTSVIGARGTTSLETITIHDAASGSDETAPASAVFIFIGAAPHTEWVSGVLMRDSQGFILTGTDLPRAKVGARPDGWPLDREPFLLEASMPGVFVAGDVRHGSVKRVASAVGEGAMAVQLVHQFRKTTRL